MDSRVMKLREERVKPKVPDVELQNSAIQIIVTTRVRHLKLTSLRFAVVKQSIPSTNAVAPTAAVDARRT